MFRLFDLIFTSKASLLRRLKEKEKIIRFNSWFIRTWAHDQRTAVYAIDSAVKFIDQNGGAVSRDELDLLQAGLQLLQDGASNLTDLLNSEPSIKNEFVDVVDILNGVIHLYSATANFKEVNLVMQLDGSAPSDFYSDALMIKRILGNLISNAVKFSPKGEKVTIRCYGEHNFLFFQVEDKGPGIPPDKREVIFHPYVKLIDGHLGTGLGLAICRSFARALGGDIKVQSTLDQGSIFSVKIKAVNV
jgi:signal transduction histidine kinase